MIWFLLWTAIITGIVLWHAALKDDARYYVMKYTAIIGSVIIAVYFIINH